MGRTEGILSNQVDICLVWADGRFGCLRWVDEEVWDEMEEAMLLIKELCQQESHKVERYERKRRCSGDVWYKVERRL